MLVLPDVARPHDISRNGCLLLSHQTRRKQLRAPFPGDTAEHPYSWLDDSVSNAISADGNRDWLAYWRRTDGSPAVPLGQGKAVVSPDGNSVLAWNSKDRNLTLEPIGAGESKVLPTPGLILFDDAVWSDDGRQIAYEVQTQAHDWNVYTQPVGGGPPLLVKSGGRDAHPVLSPDGAVVALTDPARGIFLYPRDGAPPAAVKGALATERPIRFADGGKRLLVAEPTGHELVLTLLDLATGHREPWKRLATEARQLDLMVVTPDLKYYAYQSPRFSSDLYLVDGLR